MAHRLVRLGILLALWCAIIGVVTGTTALADDTTATPAPPAPLSLTITGTATSGTAGIAIPPGYPITLHVLRPGAEIEADAVRYDSALEHDGSFRFDQIAAMPGDLVFVSTIFEGIQQSSVIVGLSPETPAFELPLVLYALTSDPAVITLVRVQHILDLKPGGMMQVLASYFYRNLSDRLYLSPEQSAGGRRVSVTMPLPVGAVGIAFDSAERFTVGGTAVAPIVQDTRPVRPGQLHEVVFSYQVPYARGATIDQDYPFAAEAVEILIPDDAAVRLVGGEEIISRAPGPPRTATFSVSRNTTLNPARPYTQYTLESPLRAGDRLIYTLTGGSPPATSQETASDEEPSLVALFLFAIVIIGVIGGGTALFRRLFTPHTT